MAITLFFTKNPDTKELNLTKAQQGNSIAASVDSSKAISCVHKLFQKIIQLNQTASEMLPNLQSFTVILTPVPTSTDFSLQIIGENLDLNIKKLKPETAQGLISSVTPQSPKTQTLANNETDELPNPDFGSVPTPGSIFDTTARHEAELLRKAQETSSDSKLACPSIQEVLPELNPSHLPLVKKDPDYENTAKSIQLLKYPDIDKSLNRPNPSETLESKKAKIKTLISDLKAKDLAQESRKILEKISSEIQQLLQSDEPVAESFLDHILSCKTALLGCTQAEFLKEIQQLGKAVTIGLTQIRLHELGRQVEALDAEYKKAPYERYEANQVFTLRDLDEFLKDLSESEIEKRLSFYQQEEPKRAVQTFISNLAKIHEGEDYFFRPAPRSMTLLKSKISALLSTFQAVLPHYQKSKELWEAILNLLDLMEQATTASIWKQPIIATKLIYAVNQMKNRLEELSKCVAIENQIKFQMLTEELLRSQMEEMITKSSPPEQLNAAITGLRGSYETPDMYSWMSQNVYALRTRNEKERSRVESIQKGIAEISALKKLSQDRKTLQSLYELRNSANPPSDLAEKIRLLENQEHTLPFQSIGLFKKTNLAETSLIARKQNEAEQKFRRIQKEHDDVQSEYHQLYSTYQELLKTY